MRDFFSDFKTVTKAEWQNKIESDLKGKNSKLLLIEDEIEDIKISSYYHNEDAINDTETPGNYPYKRGMNVPNNQFSNGALIVVSDEKEANTKALHALNCGADLLVFKSNNHLTDWEQVLKGVKFEYISCQFAIQSIQEFTALYALLKNERNIDYNIDFHASNFELSHLAEVATNFRKVQTRFCAVNGFRLQQVGANAWQEISFCLSTSHEYLVELMRAGLSIDEASACITFNIGIGSNYFLEIAKIRSLKSLWSKIIRAYSPEHACSYNCNITAVITHVNKSLKDPETNLLRQTTEAMSAINAGINALVILPFDLYSTQSVSSFAERMALNINSILCEESYFNKVVDPMGGSYSIEKMTSTLGKKIWLEFQEIDSKGGAFSNQTLSYLLANVSEKSLMRIEKFNRGEITGIGINIYQPEEIQSAEWTLNEEYLGLKPLILESEYKSVSV